MLHADPEDVQVTTQDNVDYYVHAAQLRAHSENSFGGLLTRPIGFWQRIAVAEESTVFNVVLHAVYGLDCGQYNPTDDEIISAVHALYSYGVPPARILSPATILFPLIISNLPNRTATEVLRFYALAGQYDFRDLAVYCSQFLLSLRVQSISSEIAQQMGVMYLKHLIFLLHGRRQELQNLLSRPPQTHLVIPECSPDRQAALERAWHLTGAWFIWNASIGKSAFLALHSRVSRRSLLLTTHDPRAHFRGTGGALFRAGRRANV